MNERPAETADDRSEALLRMRSITKRFPGVTALDGVDLDLLAGEVVAVIGENGAGKTTLIKILGGIYSPDGGSISLDGEPIRFSSVHDSLARGISIIHQELVLAENLDIAANIFLGREIVRGGWLGVLDSARMNERTSELLGVVGLNLAPTTPMARLSIAEKQLVEIAKALALDSRIVVMDEPTSSLSSREAELLFKVIEDLKSRRIGVIYISHRLAEIPRVADRVVALRDGKRVGELVGADMTEKRMIRLMIGREISDFYPRTHKPSDTTLLRVEGLRLASAKNPVSFELKAGEVLGFAGLVGAGRTEIMRALFGVDPIEEGRIEIEGVPVKIRSPWDAISHGIAMAPEDRKLQGLILEMAVGDNLTLAGLRKLAPWGWINRRRTREAARKQFDRLSIRGSGLDQEVINLSGGNQQKVVLGKWLLLEPKILILDEPTRGIDVGAKTEVYQMMSELTARGMGILMISSEMEEVLGVSDRIVVMYEGSIRGVLERDAFSEEAVMTLASGRRLPV